MLSISVTKSEIKCTVINNTMLIFEREGGGERNLMYLSYNCFFNISKYKIIFNNAAYFK